MLRRSQKPTAKRQRPKPGARILLAAVARWRCYALRRLTGVVLDAETRSRWHAAIAAPGPESQYDRRLCRRVSR